MAVSSRAVALPERASFARIPDIRPMPGLIQIQLDSFEWFKKEGLRELFEEISPIKDFTGKNLSLEFIVPPEPFGKPKYSEDECRDRDATYSAPLNVRARLINKETGEIIEKDIFMGDFPLMTKEGTFIINGAERVVVSQLVRSPGVYFTADEDATAGRKLFAAKLIPDRGAWLEFETSNKNLLTVKIDRKRKLPVTTLLRALAGLAREQWYGEQLDLTTDQGLLDAFRDVDTDPNVRYIQATLDRDPIKREDEALLELYKKIRPGDPATIDNARSLVRNMFFNPRRYDLGSVGRYKLNRKLDLSTPQSERILTQDDLVNIIRRLIELNNGHGRKDDIDHLGNRRVRCVGELIQTQFRVGLLRMERVVKERMSIQEPGQATPNALINIRPVVAAMKEFFGGSQLSQFMDQTNALAEIGHKRRLSALGPGGLSRERAGFDVRDVHQSHYGRICPIETPEGPNIGLIGSLATFARVNEFGFIETPFRRVYQENGKTRISDEIVFLSADEEDKYTVAQANAPIDDKGYFAVQHVACRTRHTFKDLPVAEVDYMDVSPKQTVSVATALIPFLEHDDANRALMGSNMQRQAVPLLVSESVVRDDKYTSIHIEEFEIEARDTKLGAEEITRDLPNIAEESLKNLNERGIIYVGAEVHPGDILVGKITPKGESELSAEERLLRAIFGEKAREVRDSSLRVPHGERGTVVDVKIFSREAGHELPPGVNELVRVHVAQKRKISQGDKMAGRHGNKGVIARILPIEDMPYLPDGTPVEIVLNPLGVPSRMNLGQVLETHLGYAAHALGLKVASPVFDGAPEELIEDELEAAGLPRSGKQVLRDGRTGEAFDRPITVGFIYMLKLAHLVEDKIHARSTGPYSLVTQQPLGGKAQFGGQRFGEMEVWALEAYGASHILQEILTVKSDDIVGRVKAYEAIVKGENTLEAGIPESFRVLVKELEGLALGVEIQSDGEKQVILSEDDMSEMPLDLGINLERDEIDESDQWATGAPRAAQNPLDSLR